MLNGTGRIIKSLSGFFYVESEGKILSCRARGKIKNSGMLPLVGDYVSFSSEGDGGSIESVLPRKNSFVRPAVANIDAIVFVASNFLPVTDPFLIDRISVIAAQADCEMILCVNKTDLAPAGELADIYSSAGFKAVETCATEGRGVDDLLQAMKGKVCAFSGNSGVGKTSLLNRLIPGVSMPVGDVSEKLGRGRHTTRHVELFKIDEDTYIADTPGYASLDIEFSGQIDKYSLQDYFIEFAEYNGTCRYSDCAHLSEPGCSVRDAAENGLISRSRYNSYIRMYEQIKNAARWD